MFVITRGKTQSHTHHSPLFLTHTPNKTKDTKETKDKRIYSLVSHTQMHTIISLRAFYKGLFAVFFSGHIVFGGLSSRGKLRQWHFLSEPSASINNAFASLNVTLTHSSQKSQPPQSHFSLIPLSLLWTVANKSWILNFTTKVAPTCRFFKLARKQATAESGMEAF